MAVGSEARNDLARLVSVKVRNILVQQFGVDSFAQVANEDVARSVR